MKTTWQRGKVTANGIQIHYYRSGGNKPPLVFSHGATDDGACWMPVAELFCEDYDVILPDARGHGKSSSGHCNYGVVARADDLIAFCEVLDLSEPVILGHSMGAQTTLFAAAMAPNQFKAAVLEDPVLIMPGEGVFGKRDAEAVGKLMQKGAMRSKWTPGWMLRSTVKKSTGWSDVELIPWAKSKKRLSFDFIRSLTLLKDEPDGFEALSKMTCPVLLITGNRKKGAIVSEAAAEKAKSILPNLQVEKFDTGHNIRRDDSSEYVKTVKNFLARV